MLTGPDDRTIQGWPVEARRDSMTLSVPEAAASAALSAASPFSGLACAIAGLRAVPGRRPAPHRRLPPPRAIAPELIGPRGPAEPSPSVIRKCRPRGPEASTWKGRILAGRTLGDARKRSMQPNEASHSSGPVTPRRPGRPPAVLSRRQRRSAGSRARDRNPRPSKKTSWPDGDAGARDPQMSIADTRRPPRLRLFVHPTREDVRRPACPRWLF